MLKILEHSQTMQVDDNIHQIICETILELEFFEEEQF